MNGFSFRFGDTYFGGDPFNLLVRRMEFAGSGIEVPAVHPTGVAGVHSYESQFQATTLVLPCTVIGLPGVNVLRQVDDILSKLMSAPLSNLTFDQMQDRFVVAKLSGAPLRRQTGNTVQLSLAFFAPDPFFQDNDETTETFTQSGTPDTHTIEAIARSAVFIDPVIEVFPAVGTITATIIVNNSTLGEAVQNTTDFVTSTEGVEGFRIHTGLKRWQTTTDSGANYVDQMANVTGTFPRMSHLASNSLIITGPSGGTVNVKYRKRYVF